MIELIEKQKRKMSTLATLPNLHYHDRPPGAFSAWLKI